MNKVILPNGMGVFEINKHETKFVYEEIFVNRVYDQLNVDAPPNSVILDIGANIGLFSLYASKRFQNPHLYCFEPAPICAEVLRMNLADMGDRAKIFEVALGGAPGEAEFTYYPNTIMSGVLADLERDRHALDSSVRAELEIKTGKRIEDRILSMLTEEQLDDARTFRCPITTLSAVLKSENICRVALAKIDVERAEGMVIEGISDQDWSKFDAFAIEVHDLGDDEPRKMRDKIASKGFDVHLSIADNLVNSGIHQLSAVRRAA